MSKVDYYLWAVDFILSGVGWRFGGPYAAFLCFFAGALLIVIGMRKKGERDNKSLIFVDENTPYVRESRRRNKGRFGVPALCLGLAFYALAPYVKKATPVPIRAVFDGNEFQNESDRLEVQGSGTTFTRNYVQAKDASITNGAYADGNVILLGKGVAPPPPSDSPVMEGFREAQRQKIYKCASPCGLHGPYPDGP